MSTDPHTPDEHQPERDDRPTDRTELKYHLAVRSAWIAGIFSVLVCVLLLVDFSRRRAKDPVDSPEFVALKAQLQEQPGNEEVKEEIRALDLKLRQEYFRHRSFTQAGTWLLLGGAVVMLASARYASVLRRKLPMPQAAGVPVDRDAQAAKVSRWAVGGLAVVLVVSAAALNRAFQSDVPAETEQLAAAGAPEAGGEDPTLASAGATGTSARESSTAAADQPGDDSADPSGEQYWPRFRGPGGLGISHHQGVPTSWDGSSGDGIRWKTAVPLPGNNSPIVWGDRVFLTGATEDERAVYCFDAGTGEILWTGDVPVTPEGSGDPPEVMEDTGLAASTAATDGRHVFAIFPNGDVVAFDLAGSQVWIRGLGIPDNSYGHASSLTVYRDKLVVQFDQGSRDDNLSKVLALDVATGQTVWEALREVPNSWPTPIVIEAAGRDQLITAANPWVIAYQPEDGKEIWRAKCLQQDVGPSPTFAAGIVYVANEFPALTAIRADGEGDVTDTHILWEGEDGLPDTSSPLATDQYVFLLASYGILTCYDAKTGEMLWDKEFEEAFFTSSPSMVGPLLYVIGEIELEDEQGEWVKRCRAWVYEPGREDCPTVGEGSLPEGCVTSPAFQDGTIFLRGREHLYCIGK